MHNIVAGFRVDISLLKRPSREGPNNSLFFQDQKMEIQKINCILCSLTVALAVCGTDANQTHVKCISKYEEFEEESFVKNANNRNLLYKAFYPTNSHPPYSIHVTYQTISPNGTKYHIQVPRYDYVAKTWIWISSPVFLQARPEILNRVILYTLFSFSNWVPPQVTLQVPNPCQNVTFQFLLQMTASVSSHVGLSSYTYPNLKHNKASTFAHTYTHTHTHTHTNTHTHTHTHTNTHTHTYTHTHTHTHTHTNTHTNIPMFLKPLFPYNSALPMHIYQPNSAHPLTAQRLCFGEYKEKETSQQCSHRNCGRFIPQNSTK